jgi:hypothetical protein
MSTAELEINAWTQTENTIVAVEEWEPPAEEELAANAMPLNGPEPERELPDDFWQEWFGLWR